jgi:transcriptional regulator with XRE-family HTH domain
MDAMTEWPWARVAEQVRARRQDLHMSQRELADVAGTTDRLIGAIERAERDSYQDRTLRAVSTALGWSPDSIELICVGAEPVVRDLPAAPSADVATELQALRDQVGRLTDLVEQMVSQRAGRR